MTVKIKLYVSLKQELIKKCEITNKYLKLENIFTHFKMLNFYRKASYFMTKKLVQKFLWFERKYFSKTQRDLKQWYSYENLERFWNVFPSSNFFKL